jgi:hypothetical protein
MKSKMTLIAMALFATIAGCGRDDDKMNDALANDLSLAAQQQPAQLDSISAVERGLTASPATTPRSAATTTRRTTSTAPRRTASTSSSSTSSGATSTGTASQPRETVVKHTKRDAAIGCCRRRDRGDHQQGQGQGRRHRCCRGRHSRRRDRQQRGRQEEEDAVRQRVGCRQERGRSSGAPPFCVVRWSCRREGAQNCWG